MRMMPRNLTTGTVRTNRNRGTIAVDDINMMKG